MKRLWSKKRWNMIFLSIFVYFIGFKCFFIYIRFLKIHNIVSLLHYALFSIPYVMDYVITITSCFFLQNMFVRFQTLNDVWNCLPADLAVVPGQWTHDRIVDVMENTRLLHSELCGLLKAFTLGYGPMLLGFFSSSFINMLLCVYFIIINDEESTSSHPTKSFWEKILPLIVHVQIVTFLLSVIVIVSFINDKRLKIISYLRLYQISNLHLDIKQQIKMFINQISAYDSDQISAFGFFYINLNLVTSILVLLISGIITLIQMKNHPVILQFNNDTKSYLGKL
uniref:Gustatory receptor n=1 Tax=Schizaphis graminum TaxID=13262 RepID=A0A2S2NW44_SCHGA